jgi:2-oxoacid:acceptor oxidoreductase delta subunit (pyruvate/2-ketoisovalerate family)
VPEFRPVSEVQHGVPGVTVSSTTTLVNPTGSWKYIRPVYQDRVAPCNQGCPVGIDIEGYMNLLREGRVDEARDLLLRENPLPAVTGRVCYHPCENVCNRREFDEGVAIHAVERMLGDLALDAPPPRPERVAEEKVAVVGSGPAGLACAYHLARLGYGVTVFEAEEEPGGLLRYGIPEYRLPKRVLAREIERILALGIELRCGIELGRDVPWSALDPFDAAFLAIGAHHCRALGIEGENLAGVRSGLDFLREVNRGGRPALGRRVVVVGGGNTAMDCARTAIRLGSRALVLYRRTRDDMPANSDEVEEALREGVEFEFLAAPVAIRGALGGREEPPLEAIESMFNETGVPEAEWRVEGLECTRMRPGESDESGRRRPVPIENGRFFLAADTVLAAVGEDPDLPRLPPDLERAGLALRVNALQATTRAAVFAGGDVVEQPRTVAWAIGSGKRAALGIDRWLRMRRGALSDGTDLSGLRFGAGNMSMARWSGSDPVRRTHPLNSVVGFEDLNCAHFLHAPRRHDLRLPAQEARDFTETNLGLSGDDALAEARRCFNCGVCNGCELCLIFCPDLAITRRDGGGFEIAYDFCKGCGLCSAECPRGAIAMTREGL